MASIGEAVTIELERACGCPTDVPFTVISGPLPQNGVDTLGGLIPRAGVRIRVVPNVGTWEELGLMLASPCEACE